MTDRQLLELAAKAAGLQVIALVNDYVVQPGTFAGGLVIRNDRGGDSTWHPLSDDGDAFRLLCKCGMRIVENHGGTYRAVQFTLHEETDDEAEHEIEIEWPHHPAAHRDAIVRAAAEMQLQAESKPTAEGQG